MCENVRGDLEALSFAMDEVRLFLDTHPTNTCALKAYRGSCVCSAMPL